MFRFSAFERWSEKPLVLIGFLVLLFVCSASSQTTSPTSTTAPIVSNVDEVSLDLIVKTKKNKPVLDLKPEDIQIADGGVPVKLWDLHLVGSDSLQHQIIFLFDQLDSAGAISARDIAAKILKTIPVNSFRISVLNVQSRLVLYQVFTNDRTSIDEAITFATQPSRPESREKAAAAEKRLLENVRGDVQSLGSLPNTEERPLAQATFSALEDSQQIIQEQHTSPSCASLLALARAGKRIPGHKVVIYFAQSFPANASTEEIVGTIVGTATRSSVTIYTIDTNSISDQASQGLLSMMAMGSAMHASAANQAVAPQAAAGPAGAPVHALGDLSTGGMTSMVNDQYMRFETHMNGTKSPMAELADATGGMYLTAGENPRKPMQQMIKDLTTYYEASYVPPIQDYDGQFRPVMVKVVRSGLKIRAKAGYYALPSDDGTGIRPFEAPLLKVLDQEQLPQDLKFDSGILQLGELATGYQNDLLIQVPVSELSTIDDPNVNLYSTHVSVVAQIKNKAGQVVRHFSEDIPWHGSLDMKHKREHAELITMQRHFTVAPGDYVLEAAVLDRNSGKAAASRSNFLISGPSSGPFLSDLALVDHMDPLPAEIDPSEPMRFGANKIIPILSTQIPQGTKNLSLFSLIHLDSDESEQPRLEMTVMRNGEPVTQAPLQLRHLNGEMAVPYVASMQTAQLPPGDYEIIETLTQGPKVAERSLRFRIAGPQIASTTTQKTLVSTDGTVSEDPGLASVSNLAPVGPMRAPAITVLPANSVSPPSDEDLNTLIAAARKHAIDYQQSLPNFVCLEVTNRSVDSSGNGNWKHRDSFAELLRVVDKQESRTMLERDGKHTDVQRSDLDSNWLTSVGEFGSLLTLVFKPESKTEFEWKGVALLGSAPVSVLSYRVRRENANITLSGNRTYGAGFHGLLYIDQPTGGVRRITVQADELPHDFSIQAAAMTTDYDYVSIGTHEYLMPIRASVSIRRGRKQIDLNEMSLRNYRRYSSQAKMIFNQ